MEFVRRRRTVLLALSAAVVFVITYLLIMPAMTLDQQEAASQGGIDVAIEEQAGDAGPGDAADSSEAVAADEAAGSGEAAEQAEPADASAKAGQLSADGDGYSVSAEFGAGADLPLGTELTAEEITKDDEDYQAWHDEALKALQESKGGEQIAELKFAKFYDISLAADGNEVQPAAPVDVTISYDKPMKAADADHVRIVHFGVDEKGELVPEVLKAKDVDAQISSKGRMTETAFKAESFSVYAVVYTVDFEYTDEESGQTFQYSIPGGDEIRLSELFKVLGIKTQVKDVTDVKFSDESLVKVTKNLFGYDWTLESLKAFNTEELLTVRLGDGSTIEVKVTDAQYTDISSLLTSFGITGATQKPDGSYNVFPGTPYTVSLKFAEKENDTFDRNGFTYPLPSGVIVPHQISGALVPSDSGLAEIYSINYTINTNGTISFTFDIKDGKQQAFNDLRGLSLEMAIQIEFDESATTVDWGGKAQITVDKTHDVGVKKESYLGQDGYMYYTVNVTSKGDNKNISLTDTISGTALTLDQNSITETTNHGASFSNKTKKGFDISIPELKHGESATITYRAKVDYDVLANEAGVEKGKYGSVTTTGNQIRINGTDDNPDNNTSETHADHNISFSSAGKGVTEGHYNEATGKRTMNWQIKANDEHRTTISYIHDKMGEGSDKMNYSGEGITVKVVNPDWSVATTYTVPWSQLGVNANSTEWTYNIPNQYKDKNYSFVIDYTTEVDVSESIVPVTVKNDVDTDYGKGGGGGKAEPAPGSKLDMEKSVVEKDIPGGTVTWSITVDVPAGGLDRCVVTDSLPTVSGPKSFTDGFDSSSFDKARDVAGLIDGEDVSLDTSQTGKVIFTFSKGGNPGLYPVEGGRKVTITLTTTLDEDWMAYEITQDYLQYYYTHTNNAKVVANNYTVEDSASVNVNTAEPAIIKKNVSTSNAFKTGSYSAGNVTVLPAWMYRIYVYGISDDAFDAAGNLTITDTFDDDYLAYYEPDGEIVTIVEDSNVQSFHQKLTYNTTAGGSDNVGNASIAKDVQASVSGNTVTFTINKDDIQTNEGAYYPEYVINYYMHVKDVDTIAKMSEDALSAGGTLKLKNTAYWEKAEPSEVEVDYKIPIIEKDYTEKDADAGVYDFEVKVNEGGHQLGDADYLEVTDSYTNLTIDYATLVCEPADALLSYTHSGNTVTYFVKNGVPVTLRYTASALESGPFSNTVEVNNQSVTKTGTANITARGTTTAAQTSIKVLKHAGANLREGLEGVKFELYLYDENYPNNFNPNQKVIDKDYITDEKGMFTISKIPLLTDAEGNYTHTTAKYVLHEAETPEGYKALPHDYVFTVDTQTASYGQYIYLHDDTLPISNEPIKEDDISITVNKIWPDGDADLPELIRVRLYEKDSKMASASSAREVDVVEMTRGTDGKWTHTFTGLDPEKAYFIKEDPVEGYTASYSSNNILGLEQSGTINITNTKNEPDEETTSITVKKKWMQGEEEITDIEQKKDLSATVELVRYRTQKSTTAVHFYHVGESGWTKIADETIPQGTGVVFGFTASATYAGGMGVYSSIDTTKAAHESQGTSLVSGKPGQANGSKQTITVDSEGYDDLYVVWQYNSAPVISGFEVVNEGTGSGGGEATAAIDPTYISPETVTLNRENGWRASFSNLPTSGTGSDDGKAYAYTYGVRETGTSNTNFAFDAYSVDTYEGEGSNNASVAVTSGSTVTVTNTKETPQTGSLKIEKIVKVDGNTPAAEQKALVAGTYEFTIKSKTLDPAVSRTVSITFGQDGTITTAGGEGVTLDNGIVSVSGLQADEYTVEETAPTNGTRLIKVGETKITSDSTDEDRKATVTVTAGDTASVPTASFTNNLETINVTVEKNWADSNNAKGNRPAELRVTLSNNHVVTLNAGNNWTQTVTGLPKYNSAGQAIEYTWTEETIGQGYVLIGTSKDSETSSTGVVTEITTLSNGPDETYNPKTSFVGTKTWEDDGTIRPDEIEVILYKGEGNNKTIVERKTIEKPKNDTGVWPYEFSNIPVFDENGNTIVYSVEEVLPDGYVCSVNQATSSAPGYERDTANDDVQVKKPNNELTISTGVNLGFIVMKHGNDFIIWTPRKASAAEITAIKQMVAGEGNKVGDQEFSQIMSKGHTNVYGVPNNSISKGNMTASIYMDGEAVKVDFGNKNWSQLAWGQLAYTYTEGRTDLVNTQKVTDFEFGKQWIDMEKQEIAWDQDIQVTVGRSKEKGGEDGAFSLVYNIAKNDIPSSGTVEFNANGATETTPKLQLTTTTEAGKKKYSFKIEGLAYASESDGKYTYFVKETNTQLAGYLAPRYSSPSAPTGGTAAYDGGAIINEQEGGYELPSSGGPGTTWIYLLGVVLLLGCSTMLIARRRATE